MSEIRERDKEIPQNPLENKIKLIDIGQDNIGREPLSREVKTWMQKVEEASSTTQSVVNDDQGQPILSPSTPINPKVVIPITRQTFVSGFKKSFQDAGRWLSVFFLRFIKIKKGNIIFKSHDSQ